MSKKKPFVLYADEIQALKDIISINDEPADDDKEDDKDEY